MTEADTFRRSLATSLHHAGRHWRRDAAHAMAAHSISEAVAAPPLRQNIFSAMLALYLALSLDLPRPYWA